MEIDLNIKNISIGTKVWRLYPGTKKDFVRQFIKNSCVFLEIPGVVPAPVHFVNRKKSDPILAMARAYAEWHLLPSEERNRKSQPSSNIEDYYDPKKTKKVRSLFHNYSRLFNQANIGDIIVVPEDEGFESLLYFGQIESDWNADDLVGVPQFGGMSVPFRRVRWLRTDYKRRHLKSHVDRALGGRLAVKEIDDQDVVIELFRIAYNNFIYGDIAQYYFDAPAYDNDPQETIPGIRVLQFALSAAQACVDGILPQFDSASFEDIIRSGLYKRNLSSFEINFASPGGYRVALRRPEVLLLALSLITLAGCSDESARDKSRTNIINSQDSAVVNGQLRQSYDDLLSGAGGTHMDVMRDEYAKAKAGVNLSTETRVVR